MATVTFQFGLPSSIYDTAGPDDWDGTISLGGDVSSVSTVSLVGSGASYFSVSYDAQFGVATLHPVAAEKYENFAAGSYVPGKVTFDVALSVTFADGTTQVSPTDGHVSLVAVDDDPPVNLHFSAGGTLAEGQAGAVIGTLLAEDHDPAFSGTLYYALGNPAADSAYEVDGNVLRLKDDASVSGAPGTTHSVAILVSDGHAAMSYDLSYTMAAGPGTGSTTAPVVVIPDPVTNYPSGDIFDGTGSSGSTGLGSAGSGSTGGGATVVDADDGLGPAPLSHGGHADGASGGLVALPVLHHDAVWLG